MKKEKIYDVVAIGSLTVDLQMEAPDSHLEAHGIEKSLSNIITRDRQNAITGAESVRRTAGGPASNVAMGIAAHGGSAALAGKIGNDDHGQFFKTRMEAHGVHFTPLLPADSTPTTSILVLMTPDRERTFAAVLGAGVQMAPEDVDRNLIEKAKIVYLDSYLWMSDAGRETVHHAAAVAKQSGAKVAIGINDAKVVEKNREAFLALIAAHGDIILGDRREFMTLFNVQTLEEGFEKAQALGITASVTAGGKGAYAVENGTVAHIGTRKVDKIVDTNGAGDQYAAGFLYGIAQGLGAAEAGHLGAQWASEIIQKVGAEPEIRKPEDKRAVGSHIKPVR